MILERKSFKTGKFNYWLAVNAQALLKLAFHYVMIELVKKTTSNYDLS